jgi:large subunit ribosomal protein L7/L12
MFNRIGKSICNASVKRHSQFSSQQWRAFTSTTILNNHDQQNQPMTPPDAAAAAPSTTTNTSTAEYKFQYPRSKEIFDKMIQLQLEEIRLVTELINEKLGIKITEADKRGFSGAVGHGGDADGADDAQEIVKKTAFDLKLTGFDDKSKIKIIKEVRAITGLGLKEAKEMVEGVPKTLKKQIKMEEAEELKAKLEAVGATVEID